GLAVSTEEQRKKRGGSEARMVQSRSLATIAIALSLAASAHAQIGGHLAADGPFLLEDVEDLDLHAVGVARDWIPDFVSQQGGLTPILLDSSGLTLFGDQSPIGGLRFRVPSQSGFVNKSYGVPVPSEPGQSTL